MAKAAKLAAAPASATIPASIPPASPPGPFRRLGLYGLEGIAPVLARRFVEILRNLKAEGESVLVAESNDKHIAGLLDRSYVIERGSITRGA